MHIFSYVVDHDDGKEPNPFFDTCTLCRCKYGKKLERTKGKEGPRNIVELAEVGDWIVGTGGKSNQSTGNGTLIYAMKVDEVPPREEFCRKYPEKESEPPKNSFEKNKQFAIISRHFWYFGSKAICIPEMFKSEGSHGFNLEKKGRGFQYIEPENFDKFYKWLKKKHRLGKHGKPCVNIVDQTKECKPCKSSC
jgi:hypothetical protein